MYYRCYSTCIFLSLHTGDDSLLKKLEERRQAAEAREARLREASSFLDDDGIMVKIFNSLTGKWRHVNMWHLYTGV